LAGFLVPAERQETDHSTIFFRYHEVWSMSILIMEAGTHFPQVRDELRRHELLPERLAFFDISCCTYTIHGYRLRFTCVVQPEPPKNRVANSSTAVGS